MAITLRLPPREDDKLARYAQSLGRTKTDVLREFIRSLPDTEVAQDNPWGTVDPEEDLLKTYQPNIKFTKEEIDRWFNNED